MVRVIGRIDLADEVRRALTAAGIDSYVVTAGPSAAAAATGKDGSEADVLCSERPDLAACFGIKRNVAHRPVVMVTSAKHERRVLAHMRGSAVGPDAHVTWPASGDELRAAVARAIAAAGTPRQRFPGGPLPGRVMFGAGMVLLLIGVVARTMFSADPPLLSTVAAGFLGAGSLLGAPYSVMRRWDLSSGAFMLFLMAVQLVLQVVL